MKSIGIGIAVLAIFSVGLYLYDASSDAGSASAPVAADNVSIVDGVQIVEIRAKGGYLPRKSVARAGMPTIIRFDTSGTFDCSSAVRIPSLNISRNLPPNGSTDIDIGSPMASVLNGTCGMGMYRFEVDFQG